MDDLVIKNSLCHKTHDYKLIRHEMMHNTLIGVPFWKSQIFFIY